MRYFVLNKTEKRYIEIGSNNKIITNEYLIIEDAINGDIICEVIEVKGYKNIPKEIDYKFDKNELINKEDIVYIAKCKVLKDINIPITPFSVIRKPKFNEIEKIVINGKVDSSFHLGVIRGTEEMDIDMPEEFKNICPLWEEGRAINQKGIPFLLNYKKFREYPHVGFFGTTGSGKSFGLRTFCEELMRRDIPAICFDPHYELNFDYFMEGLDSKFKIDFSDKKEVFVIGDGVGINFHELELGELIHLFSYVDNLTEAQKNALEILYSKGDTIANLKNKITDLKVAFENEEKPKNDRVALTEEQIILYSKCKNRVSGSKSLQALGWKIDSLENTNIFNGDLKCIENAMLKGKLAIIRGDIKRLKMISSHVITKLYNKRKRYCDYIVQGGLNNEKLKEEPFFPMFFTILDEAHNFCPKEGISPTRAIIKLIGQEARKYGVFLGMCTQKPGVIDQTIFSQLNTKIIYRINTKEDMERISEETNLTEEQTKAMPDLASGYCYVSSAILSKTYPVRFRTTFTKSPHSSDPFEELKNFLENNCENRLETILEGYIPFEEKDIRNFHSNINIALGEYVDIKDIKKCLNEMVKKGKIRFKKNMFGISFFK